MDKSFHIGVAGNIGVGKTTLINGLAKEFDCDVYTEGQDENPFMDRYYQNPPRWALASTLFFLQRAWQTQIAIRKANRIGIQDRTIYDQMAVFHAYHQQQGRLDADEVKLLRSLADEHVGAMPMPDLFLYIRTAPQQALAQINARARGYEQGLPIQMLEDMHHLHEAWAKKTPNVMVLEGYDFRQQADVKKIADKIKAIYER